MSAQKPRQAAPIAEVEDLLASRKSVDPVPILTHRAESRVMGDLRMVALTGCGDKVRELAKCAEGRTVSVVWYCRKFNKAVDKCMKEYSVDEPLKDEMRRRHGKRYPKAVTGHKPSSNLPKNDEHLPAQNH